jgi:hypothetical protein
MWPTGTRFVDFKLESIMTTLPEDIGSKEKRVTFGSLRKVAAVPAGFTVVCLWATIGLMVTAVIVACVGSGDFVYFLAAAGLAPGDSSKMPSQ